jgi:hypothetical protein
MYEQALEVSKAIYSSDHPNVAEIYNDLGLIEKKRGKRIHTHTQTKAIYSSDLQMWRKFNDLGLIEKKKG